MQAFELMKVCRISLVRLRKGMVTLCLGTPHFRTMVARCMGYTQQRCALMLQVLVEVFQKDLELTLPVPLLPIKTMHLFSRKQSSIRTLSKSIRVLKQHQISRMNRC